MVICNTPVFIVCSGSSGSTLLSTMLSKHNDIFIGPEIYFFNKFEIYKDFDYVKKNIGKWLKEGLLTHGQIYTKTFFFNKESYNLNDDVIIEYMNSSESLQEFVNMIFSNILELNNKIIWGEKTGSNAYCLDEILKLYPDAKIIHLARNPVDSIASIKKRNSSLIHAMSHYLYNNIAALRYKNLKNYTLIKYEELVSKPEQTIEKLLFFIGVNQKINLEQANIFWEKKVNIENFHNSWNNSPLKTPNKSSIGKGYKYLSKRDFKKINSIELSGVAYDLLNLGENRHFDYLYLYKELGYNNEILCYGQENIMLDIIKEYVKICSRNMKNISDIKILFKNKKNYV